MFLAEDAQSLDQWLTWLNEGITTKSPRASVSPRVSTSPLTSSLNLSPLIDPESIISEPTKPASKVSSLFKSSNHGDSNISETTNTQTTPRKSTAMEKTTTLPVVLPRGYDSPSRKQHDSVIEITSRPSTPKAESGVSRTTTPRGPASTTSPKRNSTTTTTVANSPRVSASTPRTPSRNNAAVTPRSYMDGTASSSARLAASNTDHPIAHSPKKTSADTTTATVNNTTTTNGVCSTASSTNAKPISKFQQFMQKGKTTISNNTDSAAVTATYTSDSTVHTQMNEMHISPRERKVTTDSKVRSQSPLLTRPPKEITTIDVASSPQYGKRLTQQRESFDPSANLLPSNNVISKVKSFEVKSSSTVGEDVDKPQRAPSRTRSTSILRLQDHFLQKPITAAPEPSPPVRAVSRTRSTAIMHLQDQFEKKAPVLSAEPSPVVRNVSRGRGAVIARLQDQFEQKTATTTASTNSASSEPSPVVRAPSRSRGELISKLQEQYISEATKSSGTNSAQPSPRLPSRPRASSGASVNSQSTSGVSSFLPSPTMAGASTFASRDKLALFSNVVVRDAGTDSIPNSGRSSLPSTGRLSVPSLPNSARAIVPPVAPSSLPVVQRDASAAEVPVRNTAATTSKVTTTTISDSTRINTAPSSLSASRNKVVAPVQVPDQAPVQVMKPSDIISKSTAEMRRDRNRQSISPTHVRTTSATLQGEKSPTNALPTKTASVLKTPVLIKQTPDPQSPGRATPVEVVVKQSPIHVPDNSMKLQNVTNKMAEFTKNFHKLNSTDANATTNATTTATDTSVNEAANLRFEIGEAYLRIQELEQIFHDTKLSLPSVLYNLPPITSFMSNSESSKSVSKDLLIQTVSSNPLLSTLPGLKDMSIKDLLYLQDLVNNIDAANLRVCYLEDRMLLAGIELPQTVIESEYQAASDTSTNTNENIDNYTSFRTSTSTATTSFNNIEVNSNNRRDSSNTRYDSTISDEPETTDSVVTVPSTTITTTRSVVNKEKFSIFMKSANQYRIEATRSEEDVEAERLADALSKEVSKAKMRISILENKLRKAQLPTTS